MTVSARRVGYAPSIPIEASLFFFPITDDDEDDGKDDDDDDESEIASRYADSTGSYTSSSNNLDLT